MRPKFWPKPRLFFPRLTFSNSILALFSDIKFSETETETSLQGSISLSITNNYPLFLLLFLSFSFYSILFFRPDTKEIGISLETEMSHSAFDKQSLIIYQPRDIRNKIRRPGGYIAYILFINSIFKTSFFAMLELGILFFLI